MTSGFASLRKRLNRFALGIQPNMGVAPASLWIRAQQLRLWSDRSPPTRPTQLWHGDGDRGIGDVEARRLSLETSMPSANFFARSLGQSCHFHRLGKM